MNFEDKVVFITGGTRGLGKAMAQGFLSEGASVAVNDKDAGMVSRCAEEFKGKRFRTYTADITNYEEMEGLAAKVWDEGGESMCSSTALAWSRLSFLRRRRRRRISTELST